MSYRDLAAKVDCSELAAHRRVQRLTRSGVMTFRTDFARAQAGWPTNVVLTLRVGADDATDARAVWFRLTRGPTSRCD